ncbi:hypothetical protein MHU86_19298 [Fragilaria crotonensis]|nr:hypothetical protein MHU86_19298 [Fragilaria crotonensis]
MEDLKVIDTIFGARMESAAGDTVFTLIPRHDAIHKMTHVKKTIASLYALDDAKRAAEVRGKTRITVAEDNGKYVTVGLKPNRGSVGVSEIWPQKLNIADRNSIRKLMARWRKLPRATFHQTNSVVCALHKYLQDIDRYSMDADVSNYFTFAEQGIAVALRPGDMLIFNPLYHHCLSSRTSAFQSVDVFCLSLYLKTAVVVTVSDAASMVQSRTPPEVIVCLKVHDPLRYKVFIQKPCESLFIVLDSSFDKASGAAKKIWPLGILMYCRRRPNP